MGSWTFLFHEDFRMFLRTNQAGRVVVVYAALMVLALLAVAWPAGAEAPRVYGVSEGQTLSEPAVIWAESRGPTHWMTLELRGPGGAVAARGSGRRLHLAESRSTGTPLAWDPREAAPGVYTLTATTYFRGVNWGVERLTFRVGGADAAGVEDAAVQPTGAPAAAVAPIAVELDGNATLPSATFGAVPNELVGGVSRALPITLDGAMPDGGDVLVLAWDMDRRRVVDEFAHAVEADPWQVDGEKVAELPTGRMELQLHVRHGKSFVQTARRVVNVVAAQAKPIGGLPDVSFARSAPTAITPGDGKTLALSVGGALPEDADILVIAWSLGQKSVVERFAVKLDGAPFVIPAAQLAKLPAGVNEVQALVREDGQVKRKVSHTVTVASPPSGNNNSNNTGQDSDPDPGQDTGTGNDTGDNANPDDTGNTGGGSSGGTTPDITDTNPAETPTPTPAPEPAPTVGFAANAPSAYKAGSNAVINVNVGGNLGEGSVLMLAWHHDERRMIDAFAHALTGSNRRVQNARLDKLPGGRVELQAHLRTAAGVVQVARKNVTVDAPVTEPDPEPVDNTPIPAGAGFTTFTPSGDSRVIYVSASGSDSNSGLSPNAPLRSPRRGYDLLRSGKPDHLLFKAGDTFRGGLGSFEKSGRSSNEKMVIGVYGSGPRPLFKTDGDDFVKAYGTVRHVAFVGIHAYSNKRDPSSPDYNSGNAPWQERGVAWYAKGEDIHFEDCHFEWYKDNLCFQAPSEGSLRNVRLYRIICNNAYGKHSVSHSSGMYVDGVHDMEIVESLFDHNGWKPGDTGSKTKFNHNVYVQKNTKRVNFRRCVVTRGSHNGVQLRGGGIVEDSLFAFNPWGLLVAEEHSRVRRNVFLHGNDMNSGYPLGVGVKVLPCSQADIEDNLFAHKTGTAGWTGAIEMGWRDDIIDPPGSFNVAIRRNIIADWPLDNGKRSIVKATGSANITADTGNLLDRASGGGSDPPFVDPGRDLNGYARAVGTGDHAGLLRKAVQRGRGAWDDRFAAKGATDWIESGFEFLPYD